MSTIRFDYTNVLAGVVGDRHGLTESSLEAFAEPSLRALDAVLARRTQDLRWLDLAFNDWDGRDTLPESLFEVDRLEYIDLRYVAVCDAHLARLESTFPGIEIQR